MAIFSSEAMLRYPRNLPAEALRHEFKDTRKKADGSPILFREAVVLLDSLKGDVANWYKSETGIPFNPYQLGTMTDRVRERFFTDKRFAEAFVCLGLPLAHLTIPRIPWWNELAANETGHSVSGSGALITIGLRHSLETQLHRAGVKMGILSVSVAGVIETADDYVVIGLRGGVNFPNTYHVNAGALGVTPDLISGAGSIYDFYKSQELKSEFGLDAPHICGAYLLSRIFDLASGGEGPHYVFHIATTLSLSELNVAYAVNQDEDKGEHTRLVGIKKDDASIMAFISSHYRGRVANRENRPNEARLLLPPGALALLSYTSLPLEVLEPLELPGVH